MSQRFSHLVWLGAGAATEPENLFALAEQVTLFEARESACKILQKKFPQENIAVKQLVLSTKNVPVNFTEYNLAEFSAIQEATCLKNLFPGLRAVKSEQVTGTAITDAISTLTLKDNNLLIVDIADSNLALLKMLEQQKQLIHFSEIYIQAASEPLYTDAATTIEITAFLQAQGYLLQQTSKHDPDLPWLTFGLNPLWKKLQQAEHAKADAVKQLDAVKQQLIAQQQSSEKNEREQAEQKHQFNKQFEQLTQQLDTKIANHEALQQTLKTTKTAAEKTQADLNAQISESTIALAAAVKAKQEAQQQLTKAQQELMQTKQQQAETGLQQALEQKMQKMFADQAQQLTKEVTSLKNHINSGLGNAAKQFEAFMGVQNYLEGGVKPLSFHGWPISPDIGLYIIGLIDANNYDVIIEFGSGTSTVMMAKALISKQRGVQTKVLGNTTPGNDIAIYENTVTDLPARIVTFEHNSLYHNKTTQALQENTVNHLVDLVHAPLVDYQYQDGSQYLYYNCNEKLQELSKIFKGRKANILVLVDGPPGATNKNARFPALPHLLSALPEHSFTIIMDDYKRAEEKEITKLWLETLEKRCVAYKVDEIECEKGCAVITIE